MASELGAAYISVGLSTKSLGNDIKKAFGSADAGAASGGKKSGSGFAAGFKAMVGPAIALVSTAAIGGFVKGAISDAGNLEQSIGAIDSVFKGSAEQMHGWAKSAASDVGLTANEFNELGTIIGSQLKNGGTAMDELAPKTNELIGLGSDMAAMFGGSTSDAVGALSAALRGERDTIERYGVSLTQAAVDAKAAELGFEKVGGALSQEANQAATLALIMEQTADAHGTFGKEANTYSGQVQRLSAGWGDLKASIGTLFLPVMTSAVALINESVIPALSGFVDMIGSGGLAGAFGPLMSVMGSAFAAIGQVFASLAPQVATLLTSFSPMSLIFQAMAPIMPLLLDAFTQLGVTLGQVLGAVIPVATAIVGMLMPVIQQLVTSVLPPVISTFTMVVAAIAPVVAAIASTLVPVIQALMPVVKTVFTVISNVIRSAMKIIQGVIQVVTGIISGDWSQVWQGIQRVASGVWDLIKSVIQGAINIVKSVIQSVLRIISNIWNSVWGSIGDFLASAWDGIVSAVSGGVDNVLQFFRDLPGTIIGLLSGAGSWLIDVGANIVQGLLDGIGSLAGTVGSFFLNLLPGWIVGPFKAALGIASPSKLFAGFGENIGEGVLVGVGRTERDIDRKMGGLVSVPSVPSFRAGTFEPSMAGVGGATGSGVQQHIHPAPGMSEETIGRVAVNALTYELRGA